MTPSAPRVAPFLLALVAALASLGAAAAPAAAQDDLAYRISQRATVSQMLGQTKVSLDYSRPLVRGRDELFGSVIHWGELWTPGANEATVLETDRPVTLNGHEVEAGRWSMWIIPSQVGPWELVLDARDSLFHTERPELTDDQIRIPLEHTWDGPETDALTWSFPRIAQDGATLRMNWSNLEIDLELAVESIQPTITVAAEDASAYTGEWLVSPAGPPPGAAGEAEAESADEAGERSSESGDPAAQGPPSFTLTIAWQDDGTLEPIFPPGTFAPPPSEDDDVDLSTLSPQERERAEARRALSEPPPEGMFRQVLIPRADGVFMMGWLEGDVLLDVEKIYFEFEREGDRAVRLQVRNGYTDQVMASATRVDG